jgi:hypothetical protein
MKLTLRALFVLIMVSPSLFGFDPAGPPPKKTIEWTTSRLSRAIIPYIEFHEVFLTEAIDFIAGMEIPEAYRVSIDCSRLKDPKPKITFTARDLTRLEAIGRVAEATGSDIVISPGKVTLVPKNSVELAGSDQPATTPADKPPVKDQPSTPTSKGGPR